MRKLALQLQHPIVANRSQNSRQALGTTRQRHHIGTQPTRARHACEREGTNQ